MYLRSNEKTKTNHFKDVGNTNRNKIILNNIVLYIVAHNIHTHIL